MLISAPIDRDYDGLKKELKRRTAKGSFSEDDEAAFVEILERELEKVAAFRSLKGDELARRVQHAESVVESLLSASAVGGSPPLSATSLNSVVSANNDDELRLSTLEQECNRIAVELTELSKFTRLNYSGFLKVRQ